MTAIGLVLRCWRKYSDPGVERLSIHGAVMGGELQAPKSQQAVLEFTGGVRRRQGTLVGRPHEFCADDAFVLICIETNSER